MIAPLAVERRAYRPPPARAPLGQYRLPNTSALGWEAFRFIRTRRSETVVDSTVNRSISLRSVSAWSRSSAMAPVRSAFSADKAATCRPICAAASSRLLTSPRRSAYKRRPTMRRESHRSGSMRSSRRSRRRRPPRSFATSTIKPANGAMRPSRREMLRPHWRPLPLRIVRSAGLFSSPESRSNAEWPRNSTHLIATLGHPCRCCSPREQELEGRALTRAHHDPAECAAHSSSAANLLPHQAQACCPTRHSQGRAQGTAAGIQLGSGCAAAHGGIAPRCQVWIQLDLNRDLLCVHGTSKSETEQRTPPGYRLHASSRKLLIRSVRLYGFPLPGHTTAKSPSRRRSMPLRSRVPKCRQLFCSFRAQGLSSRSQPPNRGR